MRWTSHKVSTFVIVLSIFSDFSFALIGAVSSVFPDAIEYPFQSSSVRNSGRFWKYHRTYSHWPYPYLILGLIFYSSWYFTQNIIWLYFFIIVFGSFLHLAEDALSISGIPFSQSVFRRKGFKLYKTGSFSEVFCVICLCLIAILPQIFLHQDLYSWYIQIRATTIQNLELLYSAIQQLSADLRALTIF